jgi:hypothetical protein
MTPTKPPQTEKDSGESKQRQQNSEPTVAHTPALSGLTVVAKPFHLVAIMFDRERDAGYYSHRASFSAASLADAAAVVMRHHYSAKGSAMVLRDGKTGKRFSISQLIDLIPNAPWNATWFSRQQWESFFAGGAS